MREKRALDGCMAYFLRKYSEAAVLSETAMYNRSVGMKSAFLACFGLFWCAANVSPITSAKLQEMMDLMSFYCTRSTGQKESLE